MDFNELMNTDNPTVEQLLDSIKLGKKTVLSNYMGDYTIQKLDDFFGEDDYIEVNSATAISIINDTSTMILGSVDGCTLFVTTDKI